MLKLNIRTSLIALVMTVAVAACGGGGGGGDTAPGAATPAPATSAIPAAALASVDGLVAFMNQLIDTGTNDTSEPILLGDATLPFDNAM